MSSSMDDNLDVCVVGLGAATPIGLTAPATAAAVRAGIAGFADHPYMIDRNGEPFVVAYAPYLADDLALEDRLSELALSAAREAAGLLSGLSPRPASIPAFLGIPAPRPGVPGALASRVRSGCSKERGPPPSARE